MKLLPKLLMAGIIILGVACNNGEIKDTSAEKVHVKLQSVQIQEYLKPVRTSGKVASRKQARLSFKTGGIIQKINVEEGMEVKKNQLLAELQRDEIKARVEQAKLALEKAERDLHRAENLYADSVATLEQLQNTRTAAAVARSNLTIARFNYRHSAIKSPSDGKILKKLAESDEIVGAGYPVFLFASTSSGWVVEGSLSDKEMVRLSLDDSVSISMDAYPGQIIPGKVIEIGQFADPYTGTFDVKVSIDKPHPKMVSGFVARLLIFPDKEEKSLMIPVETLMDADKFTGFVYLYVEGEVRKTRVKLGEIINGKVIVREGLQDGDVIVREGVNYIDESKEIVVGNVSLIHQ